MESESVFSFLLAEYDESERRYILSFITKILGEIERPKCRSISRRRLQEKTTKYSTVIFSILYIAGFKDNEAKTRIILSETDIPTAQNVFHQIPSEFRPSTATNASNVTNPHDPNTAIEPLPTVQNIAFEEANAHGSLPSSHSATDIQTLTNMGFTKQQSIHALLAASGNITLAAEVLVVLESGDIDDSPTQPIDNGNFGKDMMSDTLDEPVTNSESNINVTEVTYLNSQWPCPQCTFLNDNTATRCAMCQNMNSNKQHKQQIHVNNDQTIEFKTNHRGNCEEFASDCPHVCRLAIIMNRYCSSNDLLSISDSVDISEILSDFLHLITYHNGDEEFEFISISFGVCDIKQCQIFERRRTNDVAKTHNQKQIISQAILDKIHCFFCHCFDVGNKLSLMTRNEINRKISHNSNEELMIKYTREKIENLWINRNKRMHRRYCRFTPGMSCISNQVNQPQQEQKQDNLMNNTSKSSHNISKNAPEQESMYSFGYQFVYDEKWKDHSDTYFVPPLHSSFKDELMNNKMHPVKKPQFDLEHGKAVEHHCLQTNKKAKLKLQHILALMFYCNYDELQSHFTATFRKTHKDQTIDQIIKRHSHYYWFAKHLNEAMEEGGKFIHEGHISRFYQGISEVLTFSQSFGLALHGPTSTSSIFEVAVNFTNQNNGIIIEFAQNNELVVNLCPPKYLSVSWLSDYGNEYEYLFIGSSNALQIMDVTNAKSGRRYANILKALRIIAYFFSGFYQGNGWEFGEEESALNVIEHTLGPCLGFQECDYLKNEPYAQDMICLFFENRQKEEKLREKPLCTISWECIRGVFSDHKLLKDMFCYSKYEWVKLGVIHALFPRMEVVYGRKIYLCSWTLQNILEYLSKHNASRIKEINILQIDDYYISRDPRDYPYPRITADDAIAQFGTLFKQNNWKMTTDEYKGLTLELIE